MKSTWEKNRRLGYVHAGRNIATQTVEKGRDRAVKTLIFDLLRLDIQDLGPYISKLIREELGFQ